MTERLRRIDLADRFVEFFGDGRLDAVGRRSRRRRQYGTRNSAPIPASSPSTSRRCTILRETGRTAEHVRSRGGIRKAAGPLVRSRGALRATRTRSRSISTRSRSASPGRAGRRTASPRGRRSRRLAPLLAGRSRRVIRRSSPATAPWRSLRSRAAPTPPIRAFWSPPVCSLARRASFGLTPPAWVKTSLAPGSPTAERYLRRAGLLEDLEAIGFGIVGYGCTTCIGNSGPLPAIIEQAMAERGILPVAVLSGNRNFPGRVHPQLEAGFLASPPLVVAFALAGDVNRDILTDPIGAIADRAKTFAWPISGRRATRSMRRSPSRDRCRRLRDLIREAEAQRGLARARCAGHRPVPWDESSTLHPPPPFAGFGKGTLLGTYAAHPLLVLGDDITTDHISPAGPIPARSEAAEYLVERGENRRDLNVFASRRGNWEAMVRGLFTNKSVRNLLDPQIAPGFTIHVGIGRASAAVARSRALCERGRLGRCGGGRALWHGLVARLGRERRRAARRTGGAGLELRAHPSLQPDRHGHPASASSAGAASERSAPASRRSDPHRCRSRKDRSARARCPSRSGVGSGRAKPSWPSLPSRPASRSRSCAAAASFPSSCIVSSTRRAQAARHQHQTSPETVEHLRREVSPNIKR